MAALVYLNLVDHHTSAVCIAGAVAPPNRRASEDDVVDRFIADQARLLSRFTEDARCVRSLKVGSAPSEGQPGDVLVLANALSAALRPDPTPGAAQVTPSRFLLATPQTFKLRSLACSSLEESIRFLLRAEPNSILVELPDAQHGQIERWLEQLATLQWPTREAKPGHARPTRHAPSIAERAVERAAASREATAEQWLTAGEVSARLGSRAANTSKLANELRRKNQLLGVWLNGAVRFPDWQFNDNGQPHTGLAAALDLLHALYVPDGLAELDRREQGWKSVRWFLIQRGELAGRSPREALADDPGAVIKLAAEDLHKANRATQASIEGDTDHVR